MRVFSMLALTAVLVSGCVAAQKQYYDRAVTVGSVDQRVYSQVAMDFVVCSAPDMGGCDPNWSELVSSKLAMTLGRIGYQVFDQRQFQTWLVTPPLPPPGEGASFTANVGPDGVSLDVSVGPEGASASVSATGGGVVVYDSLPQETRMLIVERAGISGVVSGRINVGPPDDVTGWREVHVFIRLGDAQTGAVVWQGEWKENADDPDYQATVSQAITSSIEHLGRALEYKNPLGRIGG